MSALGMDLEDRVLLPPEDGAGGSLFNFLLLAEVFASFVLWVDGGKACSDATIGLVIEVVGSRVAAETD